MVKVVMVMILLLGTVGHATAQQERKYIREGNDLFEQQDFEKAEVEYRKAADKKADSFEAAFNMADALYKQKKYEEALEQFSALAEQEKDKKRLGEIYHNIGNTLLSMEKTEESIEAYKESLRNNPTSEQTKYNLEYARHMQQQQQQQQQQNQKNQDNQEQNQDQQQQDQNQNQQDKDQQNKDQQNQDKQNQEQQEQQQQNQEQQNKDQQNQDQQQQNQQQAQPQEGKISKEDAERLLEALANDEKQVQEKVQKQKAQEQKAKRLKIDKNW